jgi:small subunit ribosomal protein S16
MLVIRLQRTGRKGHAQFRVVVQDSRRTPTSGKIVAAIGSYNPHTKTAVLDKEKATKYMTNGAQPSERVARLFATEGIKLPDWVKQSTAKAGKIRNAEKLRRNRPAEEAAEAPAKAEPTTDEAEEVTPEAEKEPAAETEASAEAAAEETTTETEEPVEAAVAAEEVPAPEADAVEEAEAETEA